MCSARCPEEGHLGKNVDVKHDRELDYVTLSGRPTHTLAYYALTSLATITFSCLIRGLVQPYLFACVKTACLRCRQFISLHPDSLYVLDAASFSL